MLRPTMSRRYFRTFEIALVYAAWHARRQIFVLVRATGTGYIVDLEA